MSNTTERPSIQAALAAITEHDAEEFREILGALLEACRPHLLEVAARHTPAELRDKLEAADLVQETMLQACLHFADFRGASDGELSSWLRHILLNIVAKEVRRYKGTAKRELRRELPLDATPWTKLLENRLTAKEITPHTAAIEREFEELVRERLDRLEADYAQVIHWHDWEELSYEDIGRRLGRTPDAVRMLCVRAVDHLRRLMPPPDPR